MSSRVNVLFVPQWYPAASSAASGTFCREHALAASRFDTVSVLVFQSANRIGTNLRIREINDQGIRTFYADHGELPFPPRRSLMFKLNLKRALEIVFREVGQPDVIWTQDMMAFPVMKALKRPVPVLISQHWTGLMRDIVTSAEVKQLRWAFRNAERVLPAYKFTAEIYAKYNLKADVRWLPNALNRNIFHPPVSDHRVKQLLHVSGFTAQKRVPDIIHAFKIMVCNVPDCKLVFVGDGPDRSQMEAMARAELSDESFTFTGGLTKPEVAELMQTSRGLIFPSEFETFGCVLMEAMACGCPVLTTRIGGIPAVVRENEGIFVEVGDVPGIAAAMETLACASHNLDMDKISEETVNRFSYEAVGKILHEEFHRAVGMQRRKK